MSAQPTTRTTSYAPLLPIALLLALALRLLLWSGPLHQPANDEVEYITVARDLLAGRGWVFYTHYHWLRAPLYPLWLAGSLWLAGGDLHRAALPNLLLSTATVWLNYRLALALAGRRAAGVAALLTAVLWTFVTFASLYMAETLFTFLFTAGLLCLVPTTDGQRLTTGRMRWRVGLAGVCFGLATLTRSAGMLFLPAIALWLLVQPITDDRRPTVSGGRFPWSVVSGRWSSALVVLLAAVLTIAPWTVRNYLAYGRLIAVETGLSYNLWAFNEPRERSSEIFRTLENIPNPAERSDYATAKGLARLREDPAILLRKLWPDWVGLWQVKQVEDRFLQPNYYSDVPFPLFATALVLDDALYFMIALTGIAGLGLYLAHAARAQLPRRLMAVLASPAALHSAWLLYTIVTILLTHGEGRYRHFVFPVLIPYAAWLLAGRWKGNLRTSVSVAPLLVSVPLLALSAFVGYTVLLSYPRAWAGQNLARGWYAQRAEMAWNAGNAAQALALDQQALDVQRTPDGWLRLGDHAHASGDDGRALKAYRSAVGLQADYPPAVAKLGDFLRATGDLAGARQAFQPNDLDQQQVTDWSWTTLQPVFTDTLAIGAGLDFGYVAGMYPAEQLQATPARWTSERAMIRFGTPPTAPATIVFLHLRLAAPHPDGAPVAAEACSRRSCVALTVGPEWRVYTVPLALATGDPLEFVLRSATFGAGDRQLGVQISAARVR